MLQCDLNCDMGEGIGNDALIMPFISSANIACGFHAGDTETMKKTVLLCNKYKVAIGAHPSYPDKENFGRIDLLGKTIHLKDIQPIILEQLIQMQEVCRQEGATMHHLKLHGALYNRAAVDEEVSLLVCNAVKSFNPHLILYGLSGSRMAIAAQAVGIPFCNEVFADRTYSDDGTLTPRSAINALIEKEEDAVQQVLHMVTQNRVQSLSGKQITIKADTVCIHGDGKHAVAFAEKINKALNNNGIAILAK